MKEKESILTALEYLATFIDYPTSISHNRIPDDCCHIIDRFPQLTTHLEAFAEYARQCQLSELEEQYTKTFDFDPDCALELGWHLYGESYGRGDFLVKMRDLLDYCHISESVELPDHLTYVLPAVGRLEKKQAQEFCQYYVIPAMNKLLKGIAQKRSPYEGVLLAVKQLLSEVYAAPALGGVNL